MESCQNKGKLVFLVKLRTCWYNSDILNIFMDNVSFWGLYVNVCVSCFQTGTKTFSESSSFSSALWKQGVYIWGKTHGSSTEWLALSWSSHYGLERSVSKNFSYSKVLQKLNRNIIHMCIYTCISIIFLSKEL